MTIIAGERERETEREREERMKPIMINNNRCDDYSWRERKREGGI